MFESAVGSTWSGITPLFDFTFHADLLVIFCIEQKVSNAHVGAAATNVKNLDLLNVGAAATNMKNLDLLNVSMGINFNSGH